MSRGVRTERGVLRRIQRHLQRARPLILHVEWGVLAQPRDERIVSAQAGLTEFEQAARVRLDPWGQDSGSRLRGPARRTAHIDKVNVDAPPRQGMCHRAPHDPGTNHQHPHIASVSVLGTRPICARECDRALVWFLGDSGVKVLDWSGGWPWKVAGCGRRRWARALLTTLLTTHREHTMTFTKTTVAVIAAGSLAIGVGGSWLLTRPTGEPGPASTGTQTAAQPASESVAPEPAVAATPAPGVAPAPSPVRTVATGPGTPARQVSRPAATPPGTAGRVPDVTAPSPVAATRPAAPPATMAVAAPAPQPAPEPPLPKTLFEELVVSTNTVLVLRMDKAVSSEDASVEERVTATVTRDIRVGDRVAIPTGATAHGEVTLVERGGKVKERARLGVRFTSIDTGVILREGASAAKESTAKVGGGAVGGAIIGAIIGGKKGAAIGSTVGAGAGTAAVMAGGRNAAMLEAGEAVSVQLTKPAAVTVDR